MSNIFIYSESASIYSSIPSRSSGIIWVKKLGYYCLQKEKEKAEDWILLIDESIGIGQEKLLVILGIRGGKIDFKKPLKFQDMTPLTIKSSTNWNAENVHKEIEICKAKLGTVIYSVTDNDSVLKKALQLSELAQVYDITHAFAVILKKLYKNDADFKAFTTAMSNMRRDLCFSKYAHLMPPNQRSKSRFLNIDILSRWGIKALKICNNNSLSESEKKLFEWLVKKEEFVQEMSGITTLIEEISIILKGKGLSKNTGKVCKKIIHKAKGKEKMKQFKVFILNYLDNYLSRIKNRKETLLCTSDIIESVFGRYKNELSKNPMNGITDMALLIPALTSSLDSQEIKSAIDFSDTKKLKLWWRENLCESLNTKRYKAFAT